MSAYSVQPESRTRFLKSVLFPLPKFQCNILCPTLYIYMFEG